MFNKSYYCITVYHANFQTAQSIDVYVGWVRLGVEIERKLQFFLDNIQYAVGIDGTKHLTSN